MEPGFPDDAGRSAQTRQRPIVDWLLVVGGLAVILGVLAASPGGLLDKADHIGYAVCHRIPIRSYFFDGRQLPLCARCSGQYLGALFGLAFLLALRRGRAGLLPPMSVLAVLAVFLGLWAFDGLNSYLTLFPGLPHLYEPRNILRVTTGAMQGVALIALIWPFYNVTLWAQTRPQHSIASLREVAGLLLIIAAIAALVSSEIYQLLYPLALLSVAGTLLMLTLVNSMLVTLAMRRSSLARTWRDALPLLVAGLALASLEILIIDLVRAWLTPRLGLPF